MKKSVLQTFFYIGFCYYFLSGATISLAVLYLTSTVHLSHTEAYGFFAASFLSGLIAQVFGYASAFLVSGLIAATGLIIWLGYFQKQATAIAPTSPRFRWTLLPALLLLTAIMLVLLKHLTVSTDLVIASGILLMIGLFAYSLRQAPLARRKVWAFIALCLFATGF